MARILIVDDEPSVLKVLSVMLTKQGHEAITVQKSREAVSVLNSDAAFDLMLTDLRMDGVDGLELVRVAQQARPDMPAIVISAYLSPPTTEEALKAGAFGCIAKPCRQQDVLAKVTEALAARNSPNP